MQERLKLKGKRILNALDLKEAFDPWEIYDQLSVFAVFAAVHCRPLDLLVGDEAAACLNKNFFLTIVKGKGLEEDMNAAGSAQACLKKRLEDFLFRVTGAADMEKIQSQKMIELQMWESDIQKGRYYEKLDYICEKTGDNGLKALVLLAICELAEVNALECSFARGCEPTPQGPLIEAFTAVGEMQLEVGKTYRYHLRSDSRLSQGERIRTVKLNAVGGDQDQELVIELHGEKDRVKKRTLRCGQAVWVNAVGGSVIKFLPDESIGPGQQIKRKEPGSEEINIITGSCCKPIRSSAVSSFSTAGAKSGYLLIVDGQINADDCIYKNHPGLSMIVLTSVEVKMTENGFMVLLENGYVVSNTELVGISQPIISLDHVYC